MRKNQLKIGPIVYNVRYVAGLTREDGVDLYGEVDHIAKEFRLATNHTHESELVTKWHEVLHCAEDLYNIRIAEKNIQILSCMIVQVLQDNPSMRGEQMDRISNNDDGRNEVPREVIALQHISDAIGELESIKKAMTASTDPRIRNVAIALTDLEKVYSYFKHYVVEADGKVFEPGDKVVGD